jgi:xanthine dehydrogenase accessory factor
MDAAAAAGLVLEAVADGRRAVVVLRPRTDGSRPPPRRVRVRGRGETRSQGSLADAEVDVDVDARADALADRVLDGEVAEGAHDEFYVELHEPAPELVIVGAGHIARPLCTAASLLGYQVTVLDDRPAFATRERFPEATRLLDVDFGDPFADVTLDEHAHLILITRGHQYDYECLLRVLRQPVRPRYVGMIGSRRRVRATWAALLREGIPRDRLAEIWAPVGLDLGAQTPEEIAVSVAAELVLYRRGGSGRPLRHVERVLERFVPTDETGEPA